MVPPIRQIHLVQPLMFRETNKLFKQWWLKLNILLIHYCLNGLFLVSRGSRAFKLNIPHPKKNGRWWFIAVHRLFPPFNRLCPLQKKEQLRHHWRSGSAFHVLSDKIHFDHLTKTRNWMIRGCVLKSGDAKTMGVLLVSLKATPKGYL